MTQSLAIIGCGAFGAFMLPHLTPHYKAVIHDAADVSALAKKHGVETVDLARAAASDVVVVSVPVQKMETVLRALAPHLKPGALVVDVASVKVKPTKLMQEILPKHVAIVGTHPLFGPQSGKDGIKGLNVAVCNVRGERAKGVADFLRDILKLAVFETTPEDHDKQLAYVQGLTHLIGKVIVSLDLPEFQLTTRTYDLMTEMINMIRYDSDELFKAIERENPFSGEAKKSFFAAARKLEDKLSSDKS